EVLSDHDLPVSNRVAVREAQATGETAADAVPETKLPRGARLQVCAQLRRRLERERQGHRVPVLSLRREIAVGGGVVGDGEELVLAGRMVLGVDMRLELAADELSRQGLPVARSGGAEIDRSAIDARCPVEYERAEKLRITCVLRICESDEGRNVVD